MKGWILSAALAALLAPPAAAQTIGARAQDEGTYEISAVTVTPRSVNGGVLLRVLELLYPQHLREQGVSGQVLLTFRILASGFVDPESVRVDSSTHPDFSAAAATAIRILQFTPAEVDGRPVRVWAQLPIDFAVDAPASRQD